MILFFGIDFINGEIKYTLVTQFENYRRIILRFSDLLSINIFKESFLNKSIETEEVSLDDIDFTAKRIIIENPDIINHRFFFCLIKSLKIESKIEEATSELFRLTQIYSHLLDIKNPEKEIELISYEIPVFKDRGVYMPCKLIITFNVADYTITTREGKFYLRNELLSVDGTLHGNYLTSNLMFSLECTIKSIENVIANEGLFQLLVQDQTIYESYFEVNKNFATLFGFNDADGFDPSVPHALAKITTEDLLTIFKNYQVLAKFSLELRPRLL
ncbi:hypothetical protein [Emticicia sp. 17c]|uniref:hypothetical protein n=1 Tax=Emticicia sp. 17c TaxID=3127704 RepID=UPI00301D7780